MTARTLRAIEVAAYIGISRATLYRMLKDGTFPVSAIPGTHPRRWDIDALDAWRAGDAQQ